MNATAHALAHGTANATFAGSVHAKRREEKGPEEKGPEDTTPHQKFRGVLSVVGDGHPIPNRHLGDVGESATFGLGAEA